MRIFIYKQTHWNVIGRAWWWILACFCVGNEHFKKAR